ncbi:MAG: nicotinate phosphoribosyltransferase [Alphaproteobacteria bacterium]|nr:nicotinate phosphoribosyltransferase [Alphaproteobacteria bacterium]MDE2494679.1 nicotinate phosphoribosyltransferase [Alphaproteobacteria bacterium]
MVQDNSLLTDLYELTMVDAYLADGMLDTAVFEFFVRRLSRNRGFLLAAGLEQLIDYLGSLRFGGRALEWLSRSGRFSRRLIDYLSAFCFRGDVYAMPEGTVFFGDEPIVRIVASLPEAQLIESRLINIMHFQTLIASKAARLVLAADGKQLVDFGLRRAHSAEAGLLAARAAYIAGFSGSATVLVDAAFGVPAFGTMAHAFIQAHENEEQAFEHFASARPEGIVLLIDTYDVGRAAKKVVRLAMRLAARGIGIEGVRIDSGDLSAQSRMVRHILDAGGFPRIRIFASGDIDEADLIAFARDHVPIDSCGIGASLDVSTDAPVLDCAYKLEEYAGIPRRKRSEGKATWPGRKLVWRRQDVGGTFSSDMITLTSEPGVGEVLLQPVLRAGRRCASTPSLRAIRDRAAQQLAQLPFPLRTLKSIVYPVEISATLKQLAEACDRRV